MVSDVIKRGIIAYRQDDGGDWVAILFCGHSQHVRHDPPWQNRAWTQTQEGRDAMLGYQLGCRLCFAAKGGLTEKHAKF